MNFKDFSKQVCKYVREALPIELQEADTRITCLNTEEDTMHIMLLVIRPWQDIATGFCLDDWYKKCSEGIATVESAAASVINDRRLYCMPDTQTA